MRHRKEALMCTRTDHDGACEDCARTDTWLDLLTEIRDRLPEPEGVNAAEDGPADDGLAEWERELLRPATCCGKCPPIAGGGYDCTCEGNVRCEKANPDTVTLRRDDVIALLKWWTGEWPRFDTEATAQTVRAALGWGDSDAH